MASTQIIIRKRISLAIQESKLVNTFFSIFIKRLYILLKPQRKFLNLSSNKSITQTAVELYALSYTNSVKASTLLGYSTRSLLLILVNLAKNSVAKQTSLQIIYQIISTINKLLAITSRLFLLQPEYFSRVQIINFEAIIR